MVEPARFEWVTLALFGSIGVAAVGARRKSYFFAHCAAALATTRCVWLFIAKTSYF